MLYVDRAEPRLTPFPTATPASTVATLSAWCRDLEAELTARVRLIPGDTLHWQPEPDTNSTGVTVWHVARWLDFLGTRAYTREPATADLWHQAGWKDRTGYEPDGIGYLGLGALTGYTPEEMRAVPKLSGDDLIAYLTQGASRLTAQIERLGEAIHEPVGRARLSPYQTISATLQGSFGHIGEIDLLVGLRARLQR
jgi:hypothetical protein